MKFVSNFNGNIVEWKSQELSLKPDNIKEMNKDKQVKVYLKM